MDKVGIIPKSLNGSINIPSSKSLCHRAIIAAGLSSGESRISNLMLSDDIAATFKAMEKLGTKIEEIEKGSYKIKGGFPLEERISIDCIESGSTLRFLIPIAMLGPGEKTFTGRGKLVERPLDTYYRIFDQEGIEYSHNSGRLPLKVKGTLKPGFFKVEGNISSQFITGLLLALPLLESDSRIEIINNLESKGYVDLTIDILSKFGVEIINKDYSEFLIKGNQKYKPIDYRVEGDFSQAAFWLVAGIIGGNITCLDLNISSLQGDKIIVDLIQQMGGDIEVRNQEVVTRKSRTKGTIIDASQCPDLVPILTVLAALSEGETRIINASRLRIKESDRLKAISTEMNKLGAHVREEEDGLVIRGVEKLLGGVVDSWNDHRIAMALAIASIRCREKVIITNSAAVNKSYPHFWEDFKKLGGNFLEF